MRIAYLNLKSHPRGNHMLQALCVTDYKPSLIIEEDSSLAAKSYKSLITELKLVKEEPLPPTTQDIINTNKIECVTVNNHNDLETEKKLKEFEPDLIVLGDTRIIKPNIIKLAKKGVVNVHPGYLPDVRGNNPYIWSLIHDLPSGCSVHFIDESIDTGPLILREKLNPEEFTSYPHYLIGINKLCSEILVKAISGLIKNNLKAQSQATLKLENKEFDTFSAASTEVKNRVKDMFKNKYFTIKTEKL